MRALVTGGAGFIGSHVVESLRSRGHVVLALDNLATGSPGNLPAGTELLQVDIVDREAIGDAFRRFRPEVVLHQAAQTLVRGSSSDPQRDAAVNILGTLNVITAALESGAVKIVFASSGGTVYGNPERRPVSEDEVLRPISPYGVSKVAGEHYLRALGGEHGLRWTGLRYGNVYGPRDIPRSQHVITAFVDSLIRGETPVIEWDGEQSKDYVYVGDVAEANLRALEAGDGEVFNIGSGSDVTVNRIYEMVCSAMGMTVPARRGEKRPNDVRSVALDCSKADRLLGWRPRTALEEGLRITVDHYRHQAAVTAGSYSPSASRPAVGLPLRGD